MLYKIATLLATIVSARDTNLWRHKIEPFSFDIQKFEYPLEYSKYGTAVALRDTIKLLPKVENRYGAIFLDDPVETPSFEVIYSIDVKNDKNTI